MGYTIKFGDITELESDLIVNSLGIDGSIYGMLCEAILNAADSPELTNYINSLNNSNIGDIYITEPGKLLCKKILHIVTPFKYMDDDNNSLLEKAYVSLLNKAIELGYKSIVLPFVGSGANGYSEQEVSKIVTKVCGDLALKEYEENREILDITIVSYVESRRRRRERLERYYSEIELFEPEYYEKPRYNIRSNKMKIVNTCGAPDICGSKPNITYKEQKIINNTLLIQKAYTYLKPEEMLPVTVGSKPYSFVITHINEIGMDEKEFILQGIPGDIKSRWSKRTEIEKINIYRIAFISKMSFTRLLQFMMINNKQFSPENDLDMFMLKYFEGKTYYKCYDLAGLSLLCHKECKVNLTFDRKKKK